MDQVKKIAGILWVQRFWILCGVVTLLPIGGWFTTTSSLRKVTQDRKTAIDGKVKMAQTLLAKQDHPNDDSHKLLDGLRVQVTTSVGDAWRIQYEKQKGILVWPKELLSDFLAAVEPLRPLEKVSPPTGPTDEILKINLRERYRDYIGKELPKLAEKIGATWMAQNAASGDGAMTGFAGGGAEGNAEGYGNMGAAAALAASNQIVNWSSQDQQALRSRYDWSTTLDKVPRTIDVLYAQEDLWIMSALMDIIATTNKDATGRYNAIVKQIDYINLGRDVGGRVGTVMKITAQSAAGGMGMPGMSGMMPGMDEAGPASSMGDAGSGSAMMGMSAEGGMPGMMADAMDPAEFRYVDQDLAPVSASTLRTAITTESRDPANAFLVVAKRIPVKLGLTIDQRRLNVLIATCANAPLTLEVRQVRFNKQGGSTAGAGRGGMGGMGMGGMGMGDMGMGGMGSFPGMSLGGMGGPDSGMSSGFGGSSGMGMGGMGDEDYGSYGNFGPGGAGGADRNQHEKPVEIIGVVYIYNPVDVKKLGIENIDANGQAPAAAPEAAAAAAAVQPEGVAPAPG
jgi:hypothetical protein